MKASAGTTLQQRWIRENQMFLALTIAVAVIAGLSAVLFTLAIERVTRLFFGLSPSAVRLFLVPALVSVVTGILLAKFFPSVRGSGVPQTEAAFKLHGGIMGSRVPIGKFLTGVLCIGSGHSMGREGPSVQIGGGIASLVGQWLRLPPARVKELVPVGAAAALAAAFNTPVAAVVFALEEIIGDLNAPLIGSTVIASVTSVVVERSILGNEPLFRVPPYHLVHPAELAGYAVLGVVGGLVSLAFCKGLLSLRAGFAKLPAWTKVWQPAVGGVCIGLILLAAPQVMGVGYEYVDQALNGGMAFRVLVFLCLAKLVATVVSYASGNAGGIFAPSLYIGAMAGGAVGTLVHRFAPTATADPGAYALVGMGTLFAGIIRAPMTSVFMIFEITQDYQILVPLMVANMLSFVISKRYQSVPVYHALLHQDHIHLPTAGPRRSSKSWRARDVMIRDVPWVGAEASIADAWTASAAGERPAVLVGRPGTLAGIVSAAQLRDAIEAGRGPGPVSELMRDGHAHAHPDHPLDVVLERFADSGGALPVVSREDIDRVEGVVTLDGMFRLVGTPRGRDRNVTSVR
jgi:CIC family chloride channel protein